MAQLSINELTTYRWTFEQDVGRYREAGIPAIGVWRQKVSDFGEERAINLIQDSGLAVSNVLWAGGFTGSDGRSFGDSIDDALDAISLAGRLKADCVVVYSGGRSGHTHNHARRLLGEALQELLPAAKDNNVKLALEPMHEACAAEFTFLTSIEDLLDLIDQVADDSLAIVYDTYQLGFDERSLGRVAEIVDRIAVVHLGDAAQPPDGEQNRCRLGQGKLPLKEIVGELLRAGFNGYFDVELIGESVEDNDYQTLLQHSRDFVTELLSTA
ncbi:MAG: sugar phosphate isomerase/epimerase [Pirellulales bacterium]|nr:sugar phosphate isomerase/epimerase [Pirellulales bacterium]